MRFLPAGIVLVVFLAAIAFAQNVPVAPQPRPASQFFAGRVTGISDKQITVNRTVLGNKVETRTFLITPTTRMDGKPKVNSRVTVQFEAAEDGDRAVHIMVRAPQKKQ